MVDALMELLSGLHVQIAEGIVIFDRPTAVRHLASAALRGAAGYCLASHRPDLMARCFKPGQGGGRPPAGLFQPLHRRAATADAFPFRIVTWDPEGEFLTGLAEALVQSGPGRPFGGGDSLIAAVHIDGIGDLVHQGLSSPAAAWRLTLRTPVSLERQGRLLNTDDLTLGHIVQATAWRLNLLSEHYGNRAQIDPSAWMAAASLTRERQRDLQWVEPKRWSSTQDRAISLAGVVGDLLYSGLTPELATLLLAASAFHLGKHTAEGCGLVVLDPA